MIRKAGIARLLYTWLAVHHNSATIEKIIKVPTQILEDIVVEKIASLKIQGKIAVYLCIKLSCLRDPR